MNEFLKLTSEEDRLGTVKSSDVRYGTQLMHSFVHFLTALSA